MKRRNDEIKKAKAVWTAEEDDSLLKAVKKERADRAAERDAEDEEDWDEIAKSVLGKTPVQCLKRYMTLNSKLKASTPIEPPAEQDSKPPAREPKETAATKRDPEEATEKEEDEDDDGDDETGEPSSKQARTEGGETGPSWPQEETDLLKKLVEQYKESAPRWNEIAANFSNRNAIDCLTKWQSMTNPPVIKGKGSWTAEEDAVLIEKRRLYGRKWAKIAAHLPGRQGKQCRERFVNHLDPELKKGEWTDNEESILIAMHEQYGNRWANISKRLPGRSDNDVKNHWYSTIQRKFQQHGKEKLVQAALDQVRMMQSMGTMPQTGAGKPGWQGGPYQQATSTHGAAPPTTMPHHPYGHAPPMPPVHFPHSPGTYPYPPPPPHHPSQGSQGSAAEGSPYMYHPPPFGGHMPPPPLYYHPHYPPPPHARPPPHPAAAAARGAAATGPTNMSPGAAVRVHTEMEGSPKESGEAAVTTSPAATTPTATRYPMQSAIQEPPQRPTVPGDRPDQKEKAPRERD